jgi:hypothetical protein
MNPRIYLIPIALLAAVAFAATPEAEAAPFGAGPSAKTSVAFGPRIFVGGGVRFPLGARHSGGYYREVVSYTGGYYETRTRRVHVPGRQIGYDFRGEPIFSAGRTELETYQVWVPRRRIVQRVWVPHRHRAVGHVTVGGRFRIR